MSTKQFDRYTIIEQLGQGAMGTVYRAHDPQIDRTVALKVIDLSNLPHAEEWRARFRREMRIAGSLLHPNIAVVFDAGEQDDSVYIVMELLEGETLTDRMARGLTWREAITLLAPICEALDYAHRRGVVHRDVKPANIMVLPDGQAKLTDFGVARLETAPGVTKPGTLVGTPLYMAPEQVRGERVDGRADLFALGVILYEMLTGQYPFPGEGLTEVLCRITGPAPVDLTPLERRVPPALQAVVARALAKDPDERYATGAEMAMDLERCLTEAEGVAEAARLIEPSSPSPPPGEAIPQLLLFFHKSWKLASIALAGVLVVVLAVAALWGKGFGPTPTGEPLALVAGVLGRVEVRRQTNDRVVPAVFGLELFPEDAVITYEDSAADVLCHNGLLFSVEAERAITIHCQEVGEVSTIGTLDAEASSRIVRAVKEPRTIVLAPAGTRTSPADLRQVPVLIFPRNTLIAEPRPTFRWTTVEGTTAYHLRVVNAIGGAQWTTETAATELTYPAGAPALEPDVTYLVQVGAEPGAMQEEERTWFALLGDEARGELTAAVEAIRASGVSSPAERYLLGQLYSDYRLWGAAIDELEPLVAREPRAGLYRQLGDVYFESALYLFAEDRYRAALDAATAADDRAGAAAAHVGLGRVADAYGRYDEAIAHLEEARALYDELEDVERVEAAAAALAEVQARE